MIQKKYSIAAARFAVAISIGAGAFSFAQVEGILRDGGIAAKKFADTKGIVLIQTSEEWFPNGG